MIQITDEDYNEQASKLYTANDRIYEEVLNDFLTHEKVKTTFTFRNCNDATTKVRNLKAKYIYSSPYVDIFFDILEKYNYNMRQEIKDAIFNLTRQNNVFANKEIITQLMHSPYIADITVANNKTFKITSHQFGDIEFKKATDYFLYEPEIYRYLRTEELANECHKHTSFLAEHLKDFTAVTSLCPHYFEGEYYHSYSENEQEHITVDLCPNAVMDSETYHEIWQPRELIMIPNEYLDEVSSFVEENIDDRSDLYPMLKIATFFEKVRRDIHDKKYTNIKQKVKMKNFSSEVRK